MAGNDMTRTIDIASRSTLSVSAMVFVPQPSKLTSAGPNSPDSYMIQIIDNIIAELQNCPEEYFQAAASITRELTAFVIDDRSYQAVVDHLFNECVHRDNFQYNGSRLCTHLSTHLTTNYNGTFRDHLLNRCSKEFKLKDEHVKTAQGQQTLTGFTMFLAELMGTLRVQGEIIAKFPPSIVVLLSTLLSNCTTDAMLCIYRVLKISGATLDKYAPSEMDTLFDGFKRALAEEPATKTTDQLKKMSFLIELRQAKWIVEEPKRSTIPNPYANLTPQSNNGDDSADAVYYEEDQFGEQSGYYPPGSSDYQGDHPYQDNGGAYAAYDESNGYPEAPCYQGDQVYNDEVQGYDDCPGNHFEGESWQGDPEKLHIVYNGDIPYVIEDDDEDSGMSAEMLEAFEKFCVDSEQ